MKINLIGIPSHAGALESGTEAAPQHLRAAGLVAAMGRRKLNLRDLGDLPLPELPRHNIAPVRNWPAPRMVWERIVTAAATWFEPGTVALILGGDCSIATGTASYLYSQHGDDLYLMVLDAHVDAYAPAPERCIGAAGMGLWFLTKDNPFWSRPAIDPSHITILGCHERPAGLAGIQTVLHTELSGDHGRAALSSVLAGLPEHAKLLVHFDVDVMCAKDMPAAYAPSELGLAMPDCGRLLTELFADRRTVAIEVTEFSAARDPAGIHARALAELLANSLRAGADRREMA